MFGLNLILYFLAFIFIWLGAGLVVSSTSKFSSKLRLSPFAFSFVFLGILTSIPEFSVGLQAVAGNRPEIFVGNLLGGIVVIFLVIIPLLAVLGNGISLKNELDNKTLLISLVVILTPSLFILDKKVSTLEGFMLVFLYVVLLFFVERKNGIFDRSNGQLFNVKAYSYKDILKILLGIGIVFASSSIIVDKTTYFAGIFNISAFYISLFVIALGTNLPELSLAVRSVISRKREIAMGDYMGSAAANTLLFGIFTLLHGGEILTVDNFIITFLFILTALGSFYFFFRTKNYISRTNGLVLLGFYVIFVIIELTR
ncbi:MAG: sodium:calcium antiporter [Candidatus Levybacteria bacterium]|nr:sodium:calcium antiporter [Candidatus Levybacteria bacterium]